MSEDMLRLLAQADDLPEATDAPAEDAAGGPEYDAGLIVQLEEWGPDALKRWGMIVVRTDGSVAKHNSAMWYAMAHELRPEHRPDIQSVVITDPKA